MNKEYSITFRASEEERTLIKKKAKQAGLGLSDFIRTCTLGNQRIEIKVEYLDE
jgi:uncharacterized protein (DUF1778 family)